MKTKLLSTVLLLIMSAAGVFGDVLRVGSGSPYSSITSALAAASPGDEIWVSAGTYREAELIIPSGVSVYGGFTGSETKLSERNFAQNVTILDGGGIHRVATVSGRLDGFTLRNGRTGDNGGGALVKTGGILANCIAFANEAGYDGGAVFAEDGGTVKNSLLTGNRAGNDGAAIGGLGAYSAVHVTAAGNAFTYAPEIKKVIAAPDALVAGQQLSVAEPDINNPDEVDPHGSTILVKGWELDGHSIPMPYTVTYADNGKKLRFWAANAVGVGVSNEVTVSVLWTVSSDVRLLTPRAVCEGTTLTDAGITNPSFSPEPADGATYTWYIDGTPISGLDYALQYSDNGRLLTCDVKNSDESILGATTPAVRLAVMKAPDILLTPVASLSVEDGQPLCLPSPHVLSNGSELSSQGWKWATADGTAHDFNNCDKAIPAMNGAKVYFTAKNGCSDIPVTKDYITTLTVTNTVGEFLQSVPVICDGMHLGDAVSFADGDNTGDYYIGTTKLTGTSWDDVKGHVLSTADNLKVLKFVYNGGKGERRFTLQVHAVPSLTKDLVQADHNTAVCMGDLYNLGVDVDAESPGYRWQTSTGDAAPADDAGWSDVTGGSSAALRFSVNGDAWYRCLATGVCIDRTAAPTTTLAGKTYLVSTAVKVSHTSKPVIPAGFAFANADILNVCEGMLFSAVFTDAVKPAVGKAGEGIPAGTPFEGWMLGGVKVSAGQTITASDNGKALGYWALSRCGESVATFNTLTLKVSGKVSILQSPADRTVNEGGRVSLSVLTAAPAECTYLWQLLATDGVTWTAAPAGENGNDQAVYTFTTPSGDAVPADRRSDESYTDKYRCVVTSSNACGSTDVQESDAATVTVMRSSTEVAITAQPSDGEVCAGENHELKVTAKNRTALSFQWYRDGRKVTAAEGEVVAPAGDNATGTTSAFRAKVSGTYYCLVTSVDNPTGARSDEASVTVHPIPAVVTDIAPATICKGSSTTLEYVVSGDNVTYKWTDKSAPGTPLGTGSSLNITPDATTTYMVEVTAACSDKADATLLKKEAIVTVHDKPAITGGPTAGLRLCEGTVIGTPTAVSVDFKGSDEISQSWTLNGIDIKPADYTVSTADRGKVIAYRAKNGCGETINNFGGSVTLNIDKRPRLLQSPSDVTVEEGAQVRLSVLTGDKDVTYKWVSTADESRVLSTASVYSYIPKELTGDELTDGKRTEQYYCVITAAAGSTCKGDNASAHPETESVAAFEKSSIATVEIRRRTTSITITAQPSEVYPEACAKDDAGTIDKTQFPAGIGITAEGRGTLTFTWYKNGKVVAAGDGTMENSGETPLPDDGRDPLTPTVRQSSTFHPTGAGTYFCRVGSSDNTAGVRSEQVVLTVHPLVKLTSADLNDGTETLCEDSNLSLSVAATGDNRSYQWQWKAAGAGDNTYTSISGETDSRLRTTVDGSKTYRCVLTAACADGISPTPTTKLSKTHTVNISLKPSITLNAINAGASTFSLCEGAALSPTTFATVTVDNHGNTDNTGAWWTLGGQQAAADYPVKTTDHGKTLGYYAQNGCGITTASLPLSLEVNGLPLIVTQPQGTEVQAGSQVRLVVSASVGKGTLKYQWQKKGASDAGFTDIPADNATAATAAYVFTAEEGTSVTPDNVKTTYRCRITLDGSACSYDDYSGEAVVTVTRRKSSISITEQPAGYGICSSTAVGGYNPLSVTVSGTANFTYTWYKQGVTAPVRPAVTKNAGAAGHDRDSYTPEAPGVYYCKVTSEDDPTGVLSQPATVTLYEEPENITPTDASPSMCEGSVRVLGITSKGSSLTYEWHRSNDATGNTDAGACTGGNAPTYTPQGLAKGTYYYYCKVANSNCPDKVKKSGVITLTVNQSATITEHPLSKAICSGTDLELKVVASTDKANGYTWYANGTKISGQTSATLTLDKTKVEGGVYTCEVSSEHCGSVTSSPAMVTVKRKPTLVNAANETLTVCKGVTLTLQTEATGDGLHYAWKKGSDAIGSDASSLTIEEPEGVAYTCTVSGDCASPVTRTITVTVNTPASLTRQPADQAGVCTYAALGVAANGTAPSFLWYKDGSALTSGAGYNTQDYTPTADGVYYCLVSVDYCGSVMSGPAVVRKAVAVSGTLAASADRTTICKGESVTLSATGVSGDGLSYVWKSGGTEVGYGATVNISPAATADYTCTATGTCGTATSAAVPVTVNNPVVITGQPVGGEVCDAEYQLEITASATGIGYQWYKDGKEVSKATSASYTVPKTEVGAHDYYCLVSSGTCGNKTSASVRVNIVQPPTFASTTELHTQYTGFVSEPLALPAVPVYDANGSTITGGRWVYGTDTELGSVFQQDYNKQELKYEVSYMGVCNTTGGTVLSVKQGSMRVADFMSDAVPDDLVAGKFYYMMDARDRKIYKIKKFSNGQIWMVQNLDYGTCTLPFNNENCKGSVQGITGESGLLYGVCQSSADLSEAPLDDGTTYKYYNWQGVMNDANAYYNSPTNNAEWGKNWRGICPKGWRMSEAWGEGSSWNSTIQTVENLYCDNELPGCFMLTKSGWLDVNGNLNGRENRSAIWTRTDYGNTEVLILGDKYGGRLTNLEPRGRSDGLPLRCIKDNMTLTASADQTTVCKGASITLSATGVSGDGFSYVWKSGGTEVGHGAIVRVSPAASGDYTCTAMDAHDRTMASATVSVTVNNPVVITGQPVGGEVCNKTHQLAVTANADATGLGYQWYKDGKEVSGKTASYIVDNVVGVHNYYCLVKGTCGNVASASVQVNIVQPPTFASAVAIPKDYSGFAGEPIVLPTAPEYNANGSTVTGGRWIYGTGSELGSVWQASYHNQELKYQISYKGVCNSGGTTLNSAKQGFLTVAGFLSDAVPGDLVVGKFYYMMDARDRKVYRIKKMSNNQVWMMQNLDYGTCTTPYTTANSQANIQGITGAKGAIYGVCRASTDAGAPVHIGKAYKFYNWQGVMQDAAAYFGTTTNKSEWVSKWQGICPAGWHVPNTDEALQLNTCIGEGTWTNTWANASADNEAGITFCTANVGYLNADGSYGKTWFQNYWVANKRDNTTSYELFHGSNGQLKPGNASMQPIDMSGGRPIRCMKN